MNSSPQTTRASNGVHQQAGTVHTKRVRQWCCVCIASAPEGCGAGTGPCGCGPQRRRDQHYLMYAMAAALKPLSLTPKSSSPICLSSASESTAMTADPDDDVGSAVLCIASAPERCRRPAEPGRADLVLHSCKNDITEAYCNRTTCAPPGPYGGRSCRPYSLINAGGMNRPPR